MAGPSEVQPSRLAEIRAIARSGDSTAQEPEFFSAEDMRALDDQQVRYVEYVDETLGVLIEHAPAGTISSSRPTVARAIISDMAS